jgi:hypothetical protein
MMVEKTHSRHAACSPRRLVRRHVRRSFNEGGSLGVGGSSAKAGPPAVRHSASARRRLALFPPCLFSHLGWRSGFGLFCPSRACVLDCSGPTRACDAAFFHNSVRAQFPCPGVRTPKIAKKTHLGIRNLLSINHKCKNHLGLFLKTNPNRRGAGPCRRSALPASKLTLTIKLTSKSNRNKTESDHFFHQALIHRRSRSLALTDFLASDFRILNSEALRLLKPILTIIFLFLGSATESQRSQSGLGVLGASVAKIKPKSKRNQSPARLCKVIKLQHDQHRFTVSMLQRSSPLRLTCPATRMKLRCWI